MHPLSIYTIVERQQIAGAVPVPPYALPGFDNFNSLDLALWINYFRQGGNLNEEEIQRALGDSLILRICKGLCCCSYDEQLGQFVELIDLILRLGADPSEKADKISIMDIRNGEENIFSNTNCLHILYLYWTHREWDDTRSHYFEVLFDRLLDHPLINLRETFSEVYSNRDPDWDSGRSDDCRYHVYLTNLLEDATLLHYAALIGDIRTIDKLLTQDPELIHVPCSTVAGKNLLEFSTIDPKPYTMYVPGQGKMITHPRLKTKEPGIIATCSSGEKGELVYDVVRVGGVTPLHLAARAARGYACLYLIGRGAYRGLADSRKKQESTPLAYLERAYEGWKVNSGYSCNREEFDFINLKKVRKLQSVLMFIPQLPKSLPQPYIAIYKQGYAILYDTERKVAKYVYECLIRQNLIKQATRDSLSFTQDTEIPPPNRSKNTDYVDSGYQRGHLRAAANATETLESMRETFKYSNAFPQNPRLNMGYWSQLEKKVRALALENECIEVFTGVLTLPILREDGKKWVMYQVIGPGNVAVPTHAYKVVLLHNKGKQQPLAYLIPNEAIAPGRDLDSFRVSMEHIQEKSGIVFSTWLTKGSYRLISPQGSYAATPSFEALTTRQFEDDKMISKNETQNLNHEFPIGGDVYQACLTAGSGACLLHALLGTKNDGIYSYGNDDPEARRQFSDELRRGFENPASGLIDSLAKILRELKNGGVEFMGNRQVWESQADYSNILRPIFESLRVMETRRSIVSECQIQELVNFCRAMQPIEKKPRLGQIIIQNASVPNSDQEWKRVCTERRIDLLAYFDRRQFICKKSLRRQESLRGIAQTLSEIDTEIQLINDRFLALARTAEVQTMYRNVILDHNFWFTDNDAAIIAIIHDMHVNIFSLSTEGYKLAIDPINPDGKNMRVVFWETLQGKGFHYWRCERKDGDE